MDDAYEVIRVAHERNHAHVTKGYKLGEMSNLDILKQAGGELLELADAASRAVCKNLECQSYNCQQLRAELRDELADTIACLLHVAVKNGFTLDYLGYVIAQKIPVKFR